MPFTKEEILDREIEWLELLVRTKEAVTGAFGKEPSVRHIVLINEKVLRLRVLAKLVEKDKIDHVMADLKAELARYDLRLGMRVSELPPQRL